ncbi:MAG: preprotein translocase subunit Sec61beta [Candidatus Aenigmatarchaeota archaeon]
MAEKKVYMPQSTAGLIRYFESEKELIKLKPEHVVVIALAFSFIVILARFLI